MMQNQSFILEKYRKAVINCADEIKKLDRRINIYSMMRLFLIVAGIVSAYVTFEIIPLCLFLVLLTIILFFFVVRFQAAEDAKKLYFVNLQIINQNELDTLIHKQNIYDDGSKWSNDDHNYTSDLDIFGSQSLFSIVNRCATVQGNEKLADWFKFKAASPKINQRQEAIKELAAKHEFRQDFQNFLLFGNRIKDNYIARLIKYANALPIEISIRLKIYTDVLKFLIIPLSILFFYFPYEIAIGFVCIICINILIYASQLSTINETKKQIIGLDNALKQLSKVFLIIEGHSFESELGNDLAHTIKEKQGEPFSRVMIRLSHLAGKLLKTRNMFTGPILNGLFLWDIQQIFESENIKKNDLHVIVNALSVIAELEALVSLSALAFNNPAWCFPCTTEENDYTYQTVEMGHPLIPEDQRVYNNFSLQNERRIDIITGSNMAGKSTFLRTIGINAVLAFCGAPVCAQTMTISGFQLFTYMRIKDSLQQNTSTFKTELNRIEKLLALVEKEKTYILIDEMLRGTNSLDKYKGSKAVIETLITKRTAGIVATHDHQIVQLKEDYPFFIRNLFFDVIINEEGDLNFDYKLKIGECNTFNASLLLTKIGLKIKD